MFDPEKVEKLRGERLMCIFNSGNLNLQWHDWVDASDYDQLLELYRKAVGFQFGPPYMRPKIHDPQTP